MIRGTVGAAIAGLVVLIAILGSWYTVDQTERGVLLRNGAVIGTAQPGLGFKVPLIDGVEKISWYHEKRSNDDRNIGLGPNHDWSSHGADGFGLMCIHYDQPDSAPPPRKRYTGGRHSSGGGSWQSA